jgi:hypothetical protein
VILAIKLTLTPILMVLITLAARRWGYGVAGWLSGLPTTTGPISLVLALQHGNQFAAHAAVGSLGGLSASIGFCVSYAAAATRFGSLACLLTGFTTYAVIVTLLGGVTMSVLQALVFVMGVIALGLVLVPRRPPPPPSRAPWWDLPARMGAGVAFVLLLTGLSTWLGPAMSGVLSPFPLFTSILAFFSMRQGGRDATIGFIRGVLLGGFSFVAFCLVLIARLETDGLPAYLMASAAALAVNGVVYVVAGVGQPRDPIIADG